MKLGLFPARGASGEAVAATGLPKVGTCVGDLMPGFWHLAVVELPLANCAGAAVQGSQAQGSEGVRGTTNTYGSGNFRQVGQQNHAKALQEGSVH